VCRKTDKCTVPQNFNLLPFLYTSFVHVIRFITKRKYTFVFTRSDCHLTVTQGKKSFLNLHIHIYINKGCNFIITILHSARAKKSLSKSFLGLQLFGFRLSQTETFFFFITTKLLQYKNLEITNLKRKLFELAEIRSGDKGSFTMLS